MRTAQLAEEHRHKLRPAPTVPGVALGAVQLDQLVKTQGVEKAGAIGETRYKIAASRVLSFAFCIHTARGVPERTSRFNFQEIAEPLIWTRVKFSMR